VVDLDPVRGNGRADHLRGRRRAIHRRAIRLGRRLSLCCRARIRTSPAIRAI
jgi:hypothetical protein